MNGLEHDERCERRPHWFWGGRSWCRCAERALTVSRQREEEAKGEIIKLRADGALDRAAVAIQMADQRDALRAENDRLTLAASESARTLQVEITDLRDRFAQAQASWYELDGAWQVRCDALKNQVTALREVISKGMNAPSSTPICLCHNRNAVLSQRERPCWYCEVRAVLAEHLTQDAASGEKA